MPALSPAGRERLISIYGGRAAKLVELAKSHASLQAVLGDDYSVLAAEVAFAVREEMAVTLVDVVHRRLMIGLAADQGRSLAAAVARLAAIELHWGDRETRRQLGLLEAYNQRLKPPFLDAGG